MGELALSMLTGEMCEDCGVFLGRGYDKPTKCNYCKEVENKSIEECMQTKKEMNHEHRI